MKCTIDIPRNAFQNLYNHNVYKNYLVDQISNYFKFGYFEMTCFNIAEESISFDFDVKVGKGIIVVVPTEYVQMIKKEFEPKFNLEEEMRKLVVKEFEPHKDNYVLYYDHRKSKVSNCAQHYIDFVGVKYFTDESIFEFMRKIQDKNISAKEFFETYNKVFGGK